MIDLTIKHNNIIIYPPSTFNKPKNTTSTPKPIIIDYTKKTNDQHHYIFGFNNHDIIEKKNLEIYIQYFYELK